MLPVSKNEAIKVSSKMLICATDEPNSAGTMSLKIRRTPSWRRFRRGHGSRSSRRKKGSWNASCTTPATNTPSAAPSAGRSSSGPTQPANRIMTTLSSTGVNAATANRRCAFNTLPASAVNETNKMYGNVSRNMATASSNRPSSPASPARTTGSAPGPPRRR